MFCDRGTIEKPYSLGLQKYIPIWPTYSTPRPGYVHNLGPLNFCGKNSRHFFSATISLRKFASSPQTKIWLLRQVLFPSCYDDIYDDILHVLRSDKQTCSHVRIEIKTLVICRCTCRLNRLGQSTYVHYKKYENPYLFYRRFKSFKGGDDIFDAKTLTFSITVSKFSP